MKAILGVVARVHASATMAAVIATAWLAFSGGIVTGFGVALRTVLGQQLDLQIVVLKFATILGWVAITLAALFNIFVVFQIFLAANPARETIARRYRQMLERQKM